MTLLEQCQVWNENDQYQKIIDALEAVPAGRRTPEMDSELARAYNNLADPSQPEGRVLFKKAIALLKPHEEYFRGDHCWNFRMGYAYYFLDQEGPALGYFEQALAARPGDGDTQELVERCRNCLTLPRFGKNFKVRAAEAWAAFLEIEGELREMMDRRDRSAVAEELVARCEQALGLAFGDIAFELGFDGEKYQLILVTEGDRVRAFELVYFQKHAPEELAENWSVLVGRQPSRGGRLEQDGQRLEAKDVQVWTEAAGEDGVKLTLYCPALLPMLEAEEGRAEWLLSTLVDQILGEIPAMRCVRGFEMAKTPPEGEGISLEQLPQVLEDMGLDLSLDPEGYLGRCVFYEMEANEDREADWRMDVYVGSTRCAPLINEYLANESRSMDMLHRDGVAAGFFCYPLEGFTGEDRGKKIVDFRADLEEALVRACGEDCVCLGGATGLYCGYADVMAFDLPAALDAAVDFFRDSGLSWAGFHVFRRPVGTLGLLSQEKAPEVDQETGSLLSREDIRALEGLCGGVAGYFYQMISYLDEFVKTGVEQEKFTENQARRDLQLALWYAYAYLNLDEYAGYWQAVQWMKDSEESAKGCGTWYYRYGAALMYCGRTEEALKYAEQGVREEPDYPWGWLLLGKLRSHFGDRAGALEAVAQGLRLVPGDYEFETLEGEIKAGASLEEMEYHWIDPECDRALRAGLDENGESKRLAISCISPDPAGLARFRRLFGLPRADYDPGDLDYALDYAIQDAPIDLLFQMSEAGVSKLDGAWLERLKTWLDSGVWLRDARPGGGEGRLAAVQVTLRRRLRLLYRSPDGALFLVNRGADGTRDGSDEKNR